VVAEGVGGGDEILLILDEGCVMEGGGWTGWIEDAVAWVSTGVPGPPCCNGIGGFRGDIGIPG